MCPISRKNHCIYHLKWIRADGMSVKEMKEYEWKRIPYINLDIKKQLIKWYVFSVIRSYGCESLIRDCEFVEIE